MAMVMAPIAMTMVVVSDGDYNLPIRCGYGSERHKKHASEES